MNNTIQQINVTNIQSSDIFNTINLQFSDNNVNDSQASIQINSQTTSQTNNTSHADPKSSYLIQWNPNGFFAHYEEIKQLISTFDPVIICIQETLLRSDSQFKLKGFNGFSRAVELPLDQRVRGGVGILVKENMFAEQIAISQDIQAVAVRVHYPRPITICSIYFPPGQPLNSAVIEDLINSLPKPRLICADVNGRNTIWGSEQTCNRGRILEETFLNQAELMVLNDGQPTHFSSGHGTFSAIDVTFADPELNILLDFQVHDDLCHSDHFPILLHQNLENIEDDHLPRWNFKNSDWSTFHDFVENQTHDQVFSSIDHLLETTRDLAKQVFSKTSGKSKRKTVPWWSEDVKRSIIERKKAFRKFRKDPTDQNLSQFRLTRAKARYVTRKAKREKWIEHLNSMNHETPPSELWNFIRTMNGKKKRMGLTSMKLSSGEITTNKSEIAEILASAFEANSSTQAYKEDFLRYKNKVEHKPFPRKRRFNEEINLIFTLEEFEEALKSCSDGAPGPDSIPFQILKHLPISLKNKMLTAFNDIWVRNEFPESWRQATMIPILKPNKNKEDVQSYRPISLTDCSCKLMEKMINKRLMWYLEKNNLLSPLQFGFRNKRSTSDVHSVLETEAKLAFQNKEHLSILSIDLSKAYETVWCRAVLESLSKMNLGGNIVNFISKFLDSRKFRVLVGSTFSNWHGLQNGLPQGSVLSVTLFLIAINGISNCKRGISKMVGLADDWYIYARHKSVKKIEKDMQTTVRAVENWMTKTGFQFSLGKSKIIHICRSRKRKNHPDPKIKILNSLVELVNEMNILGLTFDRKLSWEPQIRQTKLKAKNRLNLLKAITSSKWGADEKTLLRLHEALVLSTLEYGSEIYGTATLTKLKLLNPIHNTGIRIATGAYRTTPTSSLYALSGLMELCKRRNLRTLTLGLRICASREHPLKEMLLDPNKAPISSFADNFIKLCKDYDVIPEDIEPYTLTEEPPWTIPLNYDINLTEFSNERPSPAILRSKFNEKLSEYETYNKIYTDGSKTDESVGAAMITENNEFGWRLPPGTSIFSAEGYAIDRALHEIESMEHNEVLVCTDSLSFIQALKNKFSWSSEINEVKNKLMSLHSIGKRVLFLWTPAHVGIVGNEKADKRAKQSCDLNQISHLKKSYKELKRTAKKHISSQWETEWKQSDQKLTRIKKTITRWISTDGLTRRDQVVLNRLRLGHSDITHAHVFERENAPTCETCNVPISIKHALFECREVEQARQRYDIDWTFLENDQRKNQKMISYTKEIQLYERI